MTKAQKCPALAILSGWYIMNNNADRGLRGTGQRRADGVFLGDAVPAGDDVPSDPDGRTHQKLKIIDAAGRKMLSDLLLIDVILPCNIVESF